MAAGRTILEELDLDAASARVLTSEIRAWFDRDARELPWRAADTTAWGVLVSEVMSQQTPVARVAPAWQVWMQRWPTPTDLADATPADVIRAWDRLGYPRRALWLRDAASKIRDDFGGQVPSNYDDLIALPGIGDYTASAVLAFAFGQRITVLDTNVRRVIARTMWGIERPPAASPTALERQVAQALLPDDDAEAAHWSVASMELGAIVCRAKSPTCEVCPVARDCSWLAAGQPAASERARPVQRFEGTDRQVRGKLMAILRAASGPVNADDLVSACSDEIQRARCLDTLIADALVEPLPNAHYTLPE